MLPTDIELFKQLTDFYSSEVFKSLTAKKDDLKVIFNDLIDAKGSDFKLKSKNSIAASKYANAIGRVKSKNSFKEKLIRKNLGLIIKNKYNLTTDNLESQKEEILREINGFDDIIGIRIVCDLSTDCENVMNLLTENIDYLIQKGIVFLPREIETQPQKMKNGLSIYRIKGLYDSKYGFELQIKSKIDQAWGDLDHFILYKDYSLYPSRSVVQKTMNNIGRLLGDVETLLKDLRSAKEDYEKSYLNNLYLDTLEKRFSNSLESILKYPYQLDKVSNVLFSLADIYDKNFTENKDEINLDIAILKFPHVDSFEGYYDCRKLYFELQVIEVIANWFWSQKNQGVDNTNYARFIDDLHSVYADTIFKAIEESDPLALYSKDQLTVDLKLVSRYGVGVNFWTSTKDHIDFYHIRIRCNEIIREVFEDRIESAQEPTDKQIDEFIHLIMVSHFEGDLSKALNQLRGNQTEEILDAVNHSLEQRRTKITEDSLKELNIHLKKITNIIKA